MQRSRIELRIPEDEKRVVQAQAESYGITVSALLRCLALEDREHRQRQEMLQAVYPQKPLRMNDEEQPGCTDE